MFAPLHAAAMSNSVELFKLILVTKGIKPNISCIVKVRSVKEHRFGVLDCAVLFSQSKDKRPNKEIIKLILDNIEKP